MSGGHKRIEGDKKRLSPGVHGVTASGKACGEFLGKTNVPLAGLRPHRFSTCDVMLAGSKLSDLLPALTDPVPTRMH